MMSRLLAILAFLISAIAFCLRPALAGEGESKRAGQFLSRESFLSRDSGRGVFFTGFDASERERFIGWGFKYAPRGRLNEPGLRFMTTTGMKLRDIDPASAIRYSRVDVTRAMLGHEWRFGSLSLSAFLGASFALHSPDAAGVLGRRGRIGPAGMVEFWQGWSEGNAHYSRASSATLILDQAARSLYVKARHGFTLPGLAAQFGPEASFSYGAGIRARGLTLQSEWRKARLGIHLSEIALRRLRLGISAGGELRRKGKGGAYATIASYIRY